MEVKTKEYSLKLPSSAIVTIKNIWEILGIISKTGKVFTERSEEHTSELKSQNACDHISYSG